SSFRVQHVHPQVELPSPATQALHLYVSATAGAAPSVAELVGAELGWNEEERGRQVDTFLALVERQRRAADPAEDAVEAPLLAPPAPGADAPGLHLPPPTADPPGLHLPPPTPHARWPPLPPPTAVARGPPLPS